MSELHRLPNGQQILMTGTPEENERHRKILEGRHKFNQEYMEKKGWNPDAITIDQIMEIRAQPGWKNPERSDNG